MKLIDAEPLLQKWPDAPSYAAIPVQTIHRIIADQPEVDPVHAAGGVYCRECKYAVEIPPKDGVAYFCPLRLAAKTDGDFCSGEKRGDTNAD